jgi:hypothetical protein
VFARLVAVGIAVRHSLTIEVGGARVRVEASFDVELLRSVSCRLGRANATSSSRPTTWTATRAKLAPDELDARLCSFTIQPA